MKWTNPGRSNDYGRWFNIEAGRLRGPAVGAILFGKSRVHAWERDVLSIPCVLVPLPLRVSLLLADVSCMWVVWPSEPK